DLVLGQVGRLGCVVGIHDTTAGVGGVLSNILQVADGRLEAVLYRTQVGAGGVYRGDSIIQSLDGQLRVFNTEDVQSVNGVCDSSGSLHLTITSSIQAKCGQAVSTSNPWLLSTARLIVRIYYGPFCNRKVFKRSQAECKDIWIAIIGHFSGGHSSTGIIDFINNAIQGITSLEIDFSIVQLDAKCGDELPVLSKTLSGDLSVIIERPRRQGRTRNRSERRLASQSFRTHIPHTEGQGLARIGTHLEALTAQAAIQQLLATKGGGLGNTGQLTGQVGEFLVQ